MARVLIIGQEILDLRERFEEAGHETLTSDLEAIEDQGVVDLVLLYEPVDLEGFRRIRLCSNTTHTPALLILPADWSSNEHLQVLRPGLDDFLMGPADLERVVAHAGLLAQELRGDRKLVRSAITIDSARHEILVEQQPVHFTATEFRLLSILASQPGQVFSRPELLRWISPDAIVGERSVDAHVRSIRKKLGSYRSLVETVRGVGYRFIDDSGPETSKHTGARHCLVSNVLPAGLFLLAPGRGYRMGRKHTNDIVLPHPSISRLHARIVWRDGAFYLVDSSTNGVRVNRTLVQGDQRLEDKDLLEIEPFHLRFREFEDVQDILNDVRQEEAGTAQIPAQATQGAKLNPFEGPALVQLCQLFSVRGHDGVLEIRGDEAEGTLEFFAGALREARCEDFTGEKAAWCLLGQTRGTFRFESREKTGGAPGSVLEDLERTTNLLRRLEQFVRDRWSRDTSGEDDITHSPLKRD